jgi:hypothetical protein
VNFAGRGVVIVASTLDVFVPSETYCLLHSAYNEKEKEYTDY